MPGSDRALHRDLQQTLATFFAEQENTGLVLLSVAAGDSTGILNGRTPLIDNEIVFKRTEPALGDYEDFQKSSNMLNYSKIN